MPTSTTTSMPTSTTTSMPTSTSVPTSTTTSMPTSTTTSATTSSTTSPTTSKTTTTTTTTTPLPITSIPTSETTLSPEHSNLPALITEVNLSTEISAEEEHEMVTPEVNATTHQNPSITWVYNQRNVSVTKTLDSVGVVYRDTLGAATYVLAVLGLVPLILGIFVLVRQLVQKSKKKVLDESEYSSEYNRSPLPTKLPRLPSHISWELEKPPVFPSSCKRWEFPREKLRLQTVLGQGNFGQVWKAEADDISGHEGLTRLVAVKTVKEGASQREKEDLLRELGIMQDLGAHPNVVTLLGCCTEKEPYLLIMEYVMYGKMLAFLREHRTRAHYFNFSDLSSALTSRDLTVFAYCVARGMEYLVSKGIIHRDLAARNILVDHNKLCKIADFGMSRNVRDTGQIYEQRPNKGALPIRWMAPESLQFCLFTHKADVWSYGILLWEIITLGSTPYATMGAREVIRRVKDGYRLERPKHCKPEYYKVLTKCWHYEPSKRPTFSELRQDLSCLLADKETGGGYVDLEALAEEANEMHN
ncbi:hypothetical protein AAG570_010994 [Ranatra chinensis]|uniref:receptor protein-tyrosine kinase n=1 Tax=Ranatra chinensis TaxID=642074 RepID=A0ABD0YXP9_9HEMI